MAKFEVQLSTGSLVYLTALAGVSGGIVIGAISAIYYALKGEWAGVLGSILSPIAAGLYSAIYAFIGYPIYRRLSNRTPSARELNGTFVQVKDGNDL